MGDDWWKWRLCYEIKLTTTVKTFTRYINRRRVGAKQQQQQTIKQTKRYRNSWIFRQKNKQTNEKKLKQKKQQQKKQKTYLQIETQADLQSTYTKIKLNILHKIKHEILYSAAIETKKY